MNRILLSFFTILALSATNAQNVRIIDIGTSALVNGQEIDVVGTPSDVDIYKYFKVTYTGFGSVTLNLKRIELDVTPGTMNSTCWGLCPADVMAGSNPVWDYGASFIPPVTINSGDTTESLQAHHKPLQIEGCSRYRYSLYDVNNATDTVYVDVRFIHTNSGVCDLSTEEITSNNEIRMYPNPVSSNLKFSFEDNHNITSLVVVDMLGKTMKTIKTSNASGVKNVDVSDLNKGFYFVKVMTGSKVIESKKLMIN